MSLVQRLKRETVYNVHKDCKLIFRNPFYTPQVNTIFKCHSQDVAKQFKQVSPKNNLTFVIFMFTQVYTVDYKIKH